MKLGRLNHVGVATPSIERSVALYRDVLGATHVGDALDLPTQGCGFVLPTRGKLEMTVSSHYNVM